MVKKPSKIRLSRETLRNLAEEDCRKAAGDGTDTRYKTCTCDPTAVCSISCFC